MDFSITAEAKAALIRMTGEAGIAQPIFTLALARRVGSDEKRLGVGIYRKDETWEKDQILIVDGIEFYVDPSMEEQLSGKVLSLKNGKFSLD